MWLSFWERGREGKLGITVLFIFHNSFGTCDRRRIQLGEGGGQGGLLREAICFMFNHIPGLSGLFGSTRGREYVMFSDNRVRKPRDRHINLSHC